MKPYTITSLEYPKDHIHTLSSYNNYLILMFDTPTIIKIDNQHILCSHSDMLLLKPKQSIQCDASLYQDHYSLTSFVFDNVLLNDYSDDQCNLYKKFAFVPSPITLIHGNNESTMLLKNLLHKIQTLDMDELQIGKTIYERGLLSVFFVLFLRDSISHDKVHQSRQRNKLILDDLFKYISYHLSDDLSLNMLEKQFFISKEHMSREFKKETGMSIHQYIVKSRIDLAKNYILNGKSIQDVYLLCGFGSYNHFFKAFKKECHMTPLQYFKLQ